jgi:hypothetical protein
MVTAPSVDRIERCKWSGITSSGDYYYYNNNNNNNYYYYYY